MNEAALKQLRKSLKGKTTDLWPDSTVIRWKSSGRYSYAVIKTPVGWFTTSRTGNMFIPQQLTYEDLTEVLARAETSDIEIATTWEPLVAPDQKGTT